MTKLLEAAIEFSYDEGSQSCFIQGIESDTAKEYWFNKFKDIFAICWENGYDQAKADEYGINVKTFDEWFNNKKLELCKK